MAKGNVARACSMCAADTGPMRTGTVIRHESCGCAVTGIGLLPNPWHVHYCTTHAAAPELLAALRDAFAALGPVVLAKHGASSAGHLKVSECDRELCGEYNRWRALIAKATEESR